MKKCKENQDHTLTTKLEKTNKPERIMTHYFNCKGQSHLLNQMCQTDTDNVNHNKGGNIYDDEGYKADQESKNFPPSKWLKTKPKVFKPP